MTGFFLGRATPQWLSIITGTLSFIAILVNQFAPQALGTYTVIAGGIVTLSALYLTFLTNTGTTPVGDARLLAGSSLTAVNANGVSLGSVQLPSEEELTK